MGGGNVSFSVLKYKSKVGVDAIVCRILTEIAKHILVHAVCSTLFFFKKKFKTSNVGTFYSVTQEHLSYNKEPSKYDN